MTNLEIILLIGLVFMVLVCLYSIYTIQKAINLYDDLKIYCNAIHELNNEYYGRIINWKNAIKIYESENQKNNVYQEIENIFVELNRDEGLYD